MYHQNSRKMDTTLNAAELVKLTSERHYKETLSNLKFDAISERTSESRKLIDCVSRLCFDKEDSEIHQEKLKRDVERIEDKIDHPTTMAEGEAGRVLRERKMEYLRKQGD